MGGISGDFAKLQQFQQRINRLVGVPQRVATVVAPIFEADARAGFASKVDPYDRPWKPIKAATLARGSASILVRSGTLMGAVGAIPAGMKVKILLGTAYAKFHITTGRGILPRAGRLPDDWKLTIKRETTRAMQDIAAGR